MTQASRARRLLDLHQGPQLLVLPNVWDVASAKLVERAGFPVIATGSAGVAFTLGYPDGQRIPLMEMLTMVKRIAARVAIPVTADLESGYGDIEATAYGLLEAGAVGLNLEDFAHGELLSLSSHLENLRTLRRIGDSAGIPIVINARTDIYLERIGPEETRFERSVERLRAFADAGADSLFVPGVRDEPTIARLVAALPLPLNILAGPGIPTVSRLQQLGVRRLSVGSALARSAWGHAVRAVTELRDLGAIDTMLSTAISYAEMNELFS